MNLIEDEQWTEMPDDWYDRYSGSDKNLEILFHEIETRCEFPEELENILRSQKLPLLVKYLKITKKDDMWYKYWGSYAATIAISMGNLKMLKMLLDFGINVNFINSAGLLYRRLEKEGDYSNYDHGRNSHIIRESLLHFAVRQNNIKALDLLLKYGGNINTKTSDGKSLLMVPSSKKMKRYLLEKGVDLSMFDKQEENCLSFEIMSDTYTWCDVRIYVWKSGVFCNKWIIKVKDEIDFEFVKLLISKGMKADSKVLYYAIERNDKRVIDLLLANGAIVDRKIAARYPEWISHPSFLEHEKNKLFHEASYHGREDIVKKLLEMGVNPNCEMDEEQVLEFKQMREEDDRYKSFLERKERTRQRLRERVRQDGYDPDDPEFSIEDYFGDSDI